ncbi:MAG TPA: thymidine kinase [Syntrophomonadaceae bacterium]|nr:thymidine kinase [Syntrophomonadaceae bacterium]
MGKIEIITGPMFSGKTTELMRRLERFSFAGRKVVLFKPELDQRTTRRISVASARQEYAIEVLTLYKPVGTDADVIAIDEGQFFPPWIVDYCQSLKDQGKTVIICGLDMDALRQPFGMMGQLMAIADSVLKLTAVCACGEDAAYTRLKGEYNWEKGNLILIGDTERFVARCSRCYSRGA